ncbi:unnamed protein product, partial [Urochloa humidicola]
YSRICTSFNKIIRSCIGDDEGYSIVTKHVAAMQAELLEMRKRKACSLALGLQSEQVGQSSGGAVTTKSKKPRKKASIPISQADTTKDLDSIGSKGGNADVRDPPITKR